MTKLLYIGPRNKNLVEQLTNNGFSVEYGQNSSKAIQGIQRGDYKGVIFENLEIKTEKPLFGHGTGGKAVLNVAQRKEVSAIVLLDPMHKKFFETLNSSGIRMVTRKEFRELASIAKEFFK